MCITYKELEYFIIRVVGMTVGNTYRASLVLARARELITSSSNLVSI